jgi:hypothetical protein
MQVWRLPRIHAGLPLKRRQKPVVGGDMGSDADAALLTDALHQLDAVLVAVWREDLVVANPKLTDHPLQAAVLVGVVEAEEVDAVVRRCLKPSEHEDTGCPRAAWINPRESLIR